MSTYNFMLTLVIAIMTGWAFYDRSRYEARIKLHEPKLGRKTYLVEPLLLPLYLSMIIIIAIIKGGISFVGTILAPAFAVLFLYISIYYAALLCLLPLFRRFISARACATLWLLPNLLYFTTYLKDIKIKPLFIITLPRRWLALLAAVWGTGFICVFLWQLVSHLRYRHFLLQGAEPATDEAVLSQWSNGQWQHEVKRPIPLLYSHKTTTPVTIGCFEQTMRLVLPPRHYTEQELNLIFRHELRHIQRCDTRTKAFLGFCVAMCWFNPLMWVARRRVADDLELSCDEAVLAGSDQTTRQQYADLLLKTAGDGRGYTTCLSGTANSLRYRLKNVVAPRKRFSGGAVVGLTMLVLLLGAGSIALASSSGTVKELIFDKAPEGITIDRVSTYNWQARSIYGWEEGALTEYLASLQVQQIYGRSYPRKELRHLYVDYAETADGELVSLTRLELCDGLLWANIPYDEFGNIVYLMVDEIDWGYVMSLLNFDAVDPDPAPQPPEMMMYFNAKNNASGEPMYAMRRILSISSGGLAQEVNKNLNNSGVGGVSGDLVTQVKLHFSYRPVDGYEIRVENWERTESYCVASEDLTDDTLPLAPYSAHYTVTGNFATVRATVYEMEFRFDVKLPGR